MFKKLWASVLNYFKNKAADDVIRIAGNLTTDFLEDFYSKKPQNCIALVSALYIGVDISLENIVAKSGNTYDDKAVAELKKELEDFAVKHNFVLANLDDD